MERSSRINAITSRDYLCRGSATLRLGLASPLCSASSTMANVLQPNMGFHPRPVPHAPSSFGFGFGLSTSNSSIASPPWSSQPGHTNPTAFQQLASSITQSSKSQKRRLDPDDELENTRPNLRDESMDRSPTPERPRRGPPKRARIVTTQSSTVKDGTKERKNQEEEDNVDIGVLLGKPISSHLGGVSHVNSLQQAYPPNRFCPFFLVYLRCNQT